MAQDPFSTLLYRTSICGLFLGATATLYFLAGLGGLVGSPPLNLATAAVFFLAALFFLCVFFVSMLDRSKMGLLLWFLILLLLSVEIVLGLLPPTARDELTHHLAIPRLYIKEGRIFGVPFAPYSYYPMLLEMLYTPWVRWGWDFVPKLIHAMFGFLTALLLYAYLARRLSPIYGLVGFFVFIFTPAILRLSTWAYVDLGVTFYSTASLLCLLRWLEAREHKRWLVLAGLLAGFALAAKPNGLLVLLALAFLLALAAGGEKERGIRDVISWVFLFLVLAFIPLSPWLMKNMVWTGNPLFPFLTGILGSGGGGGVSLGEGSGLGIFTKRELLYGENLWQIIALPLRVFFVGRDDQPQYFDGVLNPILILFLPWSFKGKWIEEKKLLFTFALIYFFYAIFLTDLRIRYILPIVPPLVILLVYGIHNVYLRIAHPLVLYGVVTFLLALNGVYLWNYSHALAPFDYLRGRESREAYLSRMLPEYPAVQYINYGVPSAARIYFLFIGRRVYYCERDYFHDADDNPWILLRMIQSAHDGSDIQLKLREKGLTHLLIREELLKRFLANSLASEQRKIWDSFVRHHLAGIFHSRGYSVYRIHG